MSTQDTFTKALQSAVVALGCDLSVDHDFSNTGVYRIRLAGTLQQLMAVRFAFHLGSSSGYAHFQPIGEKELIMRAEELPCALDTILARLRARCPNATTALELELQSLIDRGLTFATVMRAFAATRDPRELQYVESAEPADRCTAGHAADRG